MAVSASFLELVRETLAPIGPITIRRMFGAAAIYCGDLFFAVIDDDILYLKADAENRALYESDSLTRAAFTTKAGAVMELNFYTAPESIFEDEDDLRRWTGIALDAARRAAAKKAGKRRKRKPRG